MVMLCATALGAGCIEDKPITPILPDHHLTFETGALFHPSQSGTFWDGITQEELFYFSDPTTRKRIRVMRRTGEQVLDIPLATVVDSIGKIEDLIMQGRDRILCVIYPRDQIVEIDQRGRILRLHELDSLVASDRGDVFNLLSSAGQMEFQDNTLFFGLDWRANLNDPELDWQGPERLAFLKNWHTRKSTTYNLAKVHIPPNELATVELALDSFYFKLMHRKDLNLDEVGRHTSAGKYIFAGTQFSNRILVLDRVTLTPVDTLWIQQPGSKLGYPVYTYDTHDALQREVLRRDAYTSGLVFRVEQDKTTGAYLVFVLPQVPQDTPEEQWGWNRAFFVHVYDKELKGPVSIHQFEGTEHSIGEVMSTSAGMYIARQRDREKKAAGHIVFDHFTFHVP